MIHYKKRSGNAQELPLDDSHVISYNPFLLLKYGCHVNIEYVFGQKACKYIFKYILKGMIFWIFYYSNFGIKDLTRHMFKLHANAGAMAMYMIMTKLKQHLKSVS